VHNPNTAAGLDYWVIVSSTTQFNVQKANKSYLMLDYDVGGSS